jgi:hypothetical protein
MRLATCFRLTPFAVVNDPILGLGEVPGLKGVPGLSSHVVPLGVIIEAVDPLDLGGRGKRLS